MDVAKLVAFHRSKGADVTIAMHAVGEADARSKGVAQVHPSSCEPPPRGAAARPPPLLREASARVEAGAAAHAGR